MQIELRRIKVKDLVNGYTDNQEDGVQGFGGKLQIRPKYQRELVYKDKQQQSVITTVKNGFPLNTMYWVKTDNDYEVLDGQQRTLSICKYVAGEYSVNHQYFHNLTDTEVSKIMDYELMIYLCQGGTDKEKLEWFRTINIAGEKLTEQELRNATYTGSWLTHAKKYFSKTGCPAYEIGKDYVKGSPIRQDFLETALKWISKGDIENYMASKQHSQNANELWVYFMSVINWVGLTFKNYRKEMKGIDWGELYDQYKDQELDTDKIEEEIKKLMIDDSVTKKSGIYNFVLTRNEKYLNIRKFTEQTKRAVYEQQEGICVHCGEKFELKNMEADHIKPWIEGGKTERENCQLLCVNCNRSKGKK